MKMGSDVAHLTKYEESAVLLGLSHSEQKQPEKSLLSLEKSSHSSKSAKKFFNFRLKPEDFLEDSPIQTHKLTRKILFPSSNQINNGRQSNYPLNCAENFNRNVANVGCGSFRRRGLNLGLTLRPEDFLDSPPKKQKQNGYSKKFQNKGKEIKPVPFAKPKAVVKKKTDSSIARNKGGHCKNTNQQTKVNSRPSHLHPDESQPLLNVDEVEDDLIKKQSLVFRQRRHFFPSIGTIPKENDQNQANLHKINRSSRRISTVKQPTNPVQKDTLHKPARKFFKLEINLPKTPTQITKDPTKNLLLKQALSSVKKNNNKFCTPVRTDTESSSGISSVQFLKMRVASSKKRLLSRLSHQRIDYNSTPDSDFLNEEKNCNYESNEKKQPENQETTDNNSSLTIRKKCDKETQTEESFTIVLKDGSILFRQFKDFFQKLGVQID